MRLTALEKKLIAAARTSPPSEAVPYAFEKRIMSRLVEIRSVDVLTLWSRALWRAAFSSLLVTAVFSGAWGLWQSQDRPAADLTHDFERAVLVMVDQPPASW